MAENNPKDRSSTKQSEVDDLTKLFASAMYIQSPDGVDIVKQLTRQEVFNRFANEITSAILVEKVSWLYSQYVISLVRLETTLSRNQEAVKQELSKDQVVSTMTPESIKKHIQLLNTACNRARLVYQQQLFLSIVSTIERQARLPAGTRKIPSRAKRILTNWLFEHATNPYPTQAEREKLAFICDMTCARVKTWFNNNRNRRREALVNWIDQNNLVPNPVPTRRGDQRRRNPNPRPANPPAPTAAPALIPANPPTPVAAPVPPTTLQTNTVAATASPTSPVPVVNSNAAPQPTFVEVKEEKPIATQTNRQSFMNNNFLTYGIDYSDDEEMTDMSPAYGHNLMMLEPFGTLPDATVPQLPIDDFTAENAEIKVESFLTTVVDDFVLDSCGYQPFYDAMNSEEKEIKEE